MAFVDFGERVHHVRVLLLIQFDPEHDVSGVHKRFSHFYTENYIGKQFSNVSRDPT